MYTRFLDPNIFASYFREYVVDPKGDPAEVEFQKKISSAYIRAAEAQAIVSETISLNLFASDLNITQRMSSKSMELVCQVPSGSLFPAHYDGMKYSDFLLAHPKLVPFAFDIALLYEQAGNKEIADEIRKQTINFVRTSPKSPDPDDEHFLFSSLPGKFPVGVRRYCLEDTSRNESNLEHGVDLTRRLEIDVHYPAVQTKEPVYQIHRLNTDGVTDPSEKERLQNRWDRSQPDLEPSLEEKFPIIIFSHSFTSNANCCQNIVEPLVSHGYCVITINHPATNDRTFSLGHYQVPQIPRSAIFDVDSREAMTNAKDIEFVLNEIKTHKDFQAFLGESLDLDSPIGVFGQSLGGIAALEACRLQPSKIKAGLNLDGGFGYDPEPEKLVNQPFLTLLSNHEHDLDGLEQDEEIEEGEKEERQKLKKAYEKDMAAIEVFHKNNPKADRIPFPEAEHVDFSIVPAVWPKDPPNPYFKGIVKKTNKLVLNFFNLHLKEIAS